MFLANSTKMKKNFVSIVDFVELILLFPSIAAKLTMLVWNQICAKLAWYRNLSCLNESTNYCCKCQLVVNLNGGFDLRPQNHPFGDKDLRFDQFQSYSCGITHRVQIDRGYPGSTSFCTSSWALLASSCNGVNSPSLNTVVWNREEVHRVLDEFLVLLCSCSQEVPACAINDAEFPLKQT